MTEIVDGDTVRVLLGGEERAVRLIGIDAPEKGHPSRPVEYLGAEAAAALSSLCAGKPVILETDREDSDEYGRLLRYIVLPPPDGRLVNLEMVRSGHARVLTRFPFSRKSDFLREEGQARREGAGVWADGGMAELRWLARNRPDPVRVYPSGGGRYAVAHEGWGKPGLRAQEVGREAGKIARLTAEFAGADLPRQAGKAGFLPLSRDLPSPVARGPGAAPPPGTVPFEAAGRHEGREITVEGEIVRTYRSRHNLYLNFHPNWKRYLSVVVPDAELARFPKSPETFYRGKRIRVTGTVSLSQGAPQIVVRSPKAIAVLPPPPVDR